MWHDSFRYMVHDSTLCVTCSVTHMNQTRYTYESNTLHIWIKHVTHMNQTSHTYESNTLHIWIKQITHMVETCDIYLDESCHIYGWVMSHILIICVHVCVKRRSDWSCHGSDSESHTHEQPLSPYIYKYINTYTYMDVYIYIHMHIYIYIYIVTHNTCIYIYTNIRTWYHSLLQHSLRHNRDKSPQTIARIIVQKDKK